MWRRSVMPPPERSLPESIGRYRVVSLLGQGAMGRVLLAHDPVLERGVAVKLLRDDLGLLPEQRQALFDRMRHEARASARVSHPHIVSLHDMGEASDLGLYLVFEYVEGTTLKDRLARGQIGPEALARLARELGDALATAHQAGVVHRDIKPENVILSKTGSKIADFGIARVPDSTLTRDGGLLGTPAYSAPEAIALGEFSPASDQFSLAATLYEAISGRRAFPGDDAVAVATRISTEDPPRIADLCGVDPHVDTVLARALSKDPTARYPTCDGFGAALAEALTMSQRAAMPTLPDERHRTAHVVSQSRTKRVALGAAAAGALLALGVAELNASLRAPAAAAPEHGAPNPVAEAPPTAYLAEAAPKNERRRNAGALMLVASKAKRARPRDAGVERDQRDGAASSPGVDAGAPGLAVDAAAADASRVGQ